MQLAERVKRLVREVLETYGIAHVALEGEVGAVLDGCCEGEVVAKH